MILLKGDVCSVFKGAVLRVLKRLGVVDQQGCEMGSRELNEAGLFYSRGMCAVCSRELC
jgi:hypothetical protein